MKFICSLLAKPTAAPDRFMSYEDPESQRVWELYTVGTLKEIYLRTDALGAVIVLQCDSQLEAKAAINSLPMVKAGLFEVSYMALGEWSEMTRMLNEHHQAIPAWYPNEAVHSI
jgi:hypothetical protein